MSATPTDVDSSADTGTPSASASKQAPGGAAGSSTPASAGEVARRGTSTTAGSSAAGGAAAASGAAGKGSTAGGAAASSSAAGSSATPAAAGSNAAAGSGATPAAAGSNAAAGSGATSAAAGSGATSAAAGSGATAGSSAAGSGGSSQPQTPPKQQSTRCIDPSKATPDMEVSFPCDGVNLWVYLPKQCQAQSCGLIFNIHGGGMTDHATMDQATNMIALGSAANYVVVHPHKGTWDVAGDRDAIFDFLQQSIQAFGVDPKRVHSTGYSQGGQLSWALACEHADVVASIAPAEEINRVTDCWKSGKLPAREIPILFAYGRRDAIGGGYAAAQAQANDVTQTWKMQGPETVTGTESANYFRQRWTSASGNVFELISHNYTSTGVGGILDGHCLPMSSGNTFVSCATPVDYDWGKEAVTFFQAHPLP